MEHNQASYTQIKAYREHVLSGEATRKRDIIMRALWEAYGPLCREDVVRITDLPINTVSGQVATLKQGGYVRVEREDVSPYTGKTIEFLEPVKPVPPTPQLSFSEMEMPFVKSLKHSPSCFIFGGIQVGQREVCTCGADPSLAP